MKRMKLLAVATLLGAGVMFAGLSAAADDKKEKLSDKEFAQKASACGMAEVNLSELAVRYAHNAEVKKFAQRMIRDHTQAGQQLIRLANAKSLRLPAKMDDEHQKIFDKLKTLKGAEFDKCYMEAMVKDHEEAVKMFECEAKEGKDAAIKRLVAKLEPAMKKHLEMARDVCKNVKGEKNRDK